MQQPFTKKEKSWIKYDVANSAYVMLATALLSLYFNYLSPSGNLSTVWGFTNVIVTVIAVFLCPILGTYADFSKKKTIFMTFALIGICSCGILSLFSFISEFAIAGILFLIMYIVTEVGFASANVFYDSMLNDITTDDNMHRVSANGFAWGYICSCIPFAFCLLAYVLGTMVPGMEWFEGYAFTIGCLITAAWWLFFTLPLIKNYEQMNFMPRPEKPIRETFKRLGSIFGEFKKNKKALLFLVAFFFYIDGVHTIIKMATALGTDLGFDQVKLVIMLFVTQFVAFPCALIFGKLASKIPCEKLLLVAISAYTAIGVFTVFLTYEWQCWILVVSVGMFQGGVQAMSRSYFTKLIPAEKTGEFFGIYDIFGKSAAILGLGLTALLGTFYPLSQSNGFNVSLLPLPILFAIGLVLFIAAMNIPTDEGMIAKRKIPLCIIFSILTLGLYSIYWVYLLVKNRKAIENDTTKCRGEVLAFLFVPFYSLYWWYTRGESIKHRFAKQQQIAKGNGAIYLILGILGLHIVAMAIMQDDFNSFVIEDATEATNV